MTDQIPYYSTPTSANANANTNWQQQYPYPNNPNSQRNSQTQPPQSHVPSAYSNPQMMDPRVAAQAQMPSMVPAYQQSQTPTHSHSSPPPFTPQPPNDYYGTQNDPWNPPSSTGVRMRPHHSPKTSSLTNSFPTNFSSVLANPIAQMAFQTYGQSMQQQFGSGIFAWLSMHRLKYYFHVNNSYVVSKLRCIFLPFLHKNWKRERLDGLNEMDMNLSSFSTSSSNPNSYTNAIYAPPSNDVNAPDLYIPLMAFFTYVLAFAYSQALSGNFAPELIASIATTAFITILLEIFCLKFGFYLISTTAPPSFCDLTAYLSYQFVHCIPVIFVSNIAGGWLHYVAVLVFGSLNGLFVMRTIKRALTPTIDALHAHHALHTHRRNYFLLFIGVLQILIIAFLCRNAR